MNTEQCGILPGKRKLLWTNKTSKELIILQRLSRGHQPHLHPAPGVRSTSEARSELFLPLHCHDACKPVGLRALYARQPKAGRSQYHIQQFNNARKHLSLRGRQTSERNTVVEHKEI